MKAPAIGRGFGLRNVDGENTLTTGQGFAWSQARKKPAFDMNLDAMLTVADGQVNLYTIVLLVR
jgi:hypothetical protein